MRLIILLIFVINSFTSFTQDLTSKDYTKKEIFIEMRDGVKLFTSIYTPKDTSISYPALVTRTTYSCRPYGENIIPQNIMYNSDLVAKGYIFIFQDVRGRWMSEGKFENTKPPYSFWNKSKTDEVTDAWDTFEWIDENLKHYNGNIGIYGNSYLGWSTLTAAVTNHPSVKAVIAMAPVTDFFFEDFNRYGLVGINYAPILNAFGIQKEKQEKDSWYSVKRRAYLNNDSTKLANYYDYFLEKMTLKEIGKDMIDTDNFFWNNLKKHQTYDDYRQKHNWLNYIKDINCQVMIAGGWNDEQNLYGIINSFKTIDKYSPKSNVKLVMGPWAHSHPKFRDHKYYLGNVFYGYDISKNYHKNIQMPYFEYYLKNKGKAPNFKVRLFDTGKKEWVNLSSYPYNQDKDFTLWLSSNHNLTKQVPNDYSFTKYISDPNKPVPFIENCEFKAVAPKHYMTDDQRFVADNSGVITFATETLTKDITVAGTPIANIFFESDHTDADIYVKIIDVYPLDRKEEPEDKKDINYKGFQQLIRMGYLRSRFRYSYSSSTPLVPNHEFKINVPLLDIFHTFKKGHKIMIQIQSSAFPLFDINPQNYIENIYDAEKKDFVPAIHKVYSNSNIVLPIKK